MSLLTLRIKQSPCIAKHKVITANTTAVKQYRSFSVQLFNWSTTVRKVANTMSKWKTVLEMAATCRDARWETTTPLMHNSCNGGVIQLSLLSSYAVLEVVEISHASFYTFLVVCPIHCSQLDFRRIRGHNRGGMNSGVSNSLSENSIFQRRHDYVIITYLRANIDGIFFTVFQLAVMSGCFVPRIAQSCLNLSKSRPKYSRSLFPDTV